MTTAARTTAKSSSPGPAPSLWTALVRSPLLPHATFWGAGLAVRVSFPAALKWLAYDSISTHLLTVSYPLCATVSLIHRDLQQRHKQHQANNDHDPANVRANSLLQVERQYWIEYWSVGFAGVQFLQQALELFPSLHRAGLQEYSNLPVLLAQLKLMFFVWIFCMQSVLAGHQRFLGGQQQNEKWKKFVPLTFLTKAIGPKLMGLQMAISERISKETWQRLIHSKVQRVLEVLVMLQFLKETSRDYLLQLLEEGRSLLLLSVFAVLPSSVTQVGILYAKYVFPAARSLVARGDDLEVLSLKYWVLNNLFSLSLSFTWWLWWCVPFSTQVLLGLWCFATFPSTITYYYSLIEMELITFGILSGEPKLSVNKTMTVQALRHFVKRLPRDKQAQSFQFEIDDDSINQKSSGDNGDDSSIGSQDTTDSERERRRQRRRERRARRKREAESKSKKATPPPPLLSEDCITQYANDEQKDDGKYSSFVNEKRQSESDERNQYRHCSTVTEERDTRNATQLQPQQVEIRHPTSMVSLVDVDYDHSLSRPNKVEEEMSSDSLASMSDDINNLIPAPTLSMNNEMEDSAMVSIQADDFDDKDGDDSDRALLPSLTIGSNYSASQVHTDAKSMGLNIATPTENVTGEVEVQMRTTRGQARSTTTSTRPTSSIFPATYPRSSSRNSLLLLPSASIERSFSLVNSMSIPEDKLAPKPETKSKAHSSDNNDDGDCNDGLNISDVDSTSSSLVDDTESFEISNPLDGNEKQSSKAIKQDYVCKKKPTKTVDVDEGVSTPPRRSSRLEKLREWQEEKKKMSPSKASKRLEANGGSKPSKKTSSSTAEKKGKKPKTHSSSSPEKKKKSKDKCPSKSVRGSEATNGVNGNSSRRSTSKASSSERTSVFDKPTAASLTRRVEKKSTKTPRDKSRTRATTTSTAKAASPGKTTRSSKSKGEAPIPECTEVGRDKNNSFDSPNQKAAGGKPRKIPNSRRKKKDISSVFGGVLSRK